LNVSMDNSPVMQPEGTRGALRAGRLVVVVPRALPSRVGLLAEQLVGSGIEVILDRRIAMRRRTFGRRIEDRRRESRRGHPQLVGYIFGCSIVRVRPDRVSH
jgi:hypothetical protein